MTKYVVVYKDGAYEGDYGSGWPVRLIEEAGKFNSVAEATEHAAGLIDVAEIREVA